MPGRPTAERSEEHRSTPEPIAAHPAQQDTPECSEAQQGTPEPLASHPSVPGRP
ncbi:hypothetical protein PGT21_021421 [Puccinia graminis f. sp. tritici]|uniref:Uncharacterized protein n=1 Tax=Puccinia graminis f. sp. tritici TaxID=56615 RepID=A0A5B0QNP9_PUCGR|nr:hypothetical protein PGT21_021421 [Puccinia graminis f. sp. tritici]